MVDPYIAKHLLLSHPAMNTYPALN